MTETKPTVLVTRRMPAAVLDQLAQSCAVDLHPGTDDLTHDVLCARVRGKDGLICMFNDRIDAAVIAAAESLRVIATVAVGFDNIDVEAAKVVQAARGAEKTLISDVRVFDVFEGASLGEGKKSLAITVVLQPTENTLTDEEIEGISQKIVQAVEKVTGGTLRA